jgi:hypothetical protein
LWTTSASRQLLLLLLLLGQRCNGGGGGGANFQRPYGEFNEASAAPGGARYQLLSAAVASAVEEGTEEVQLAEALGFVSKQKKENKQAPPSAFVIAAAPTQLSQLQGHCRPTKPSTFPPNSSDAPTATRHRQLSWARGGLG